MACWLRCSILREFLTVVACLIIFPLAWAQHAPARVGGGAVQVPAPPMSRAPVYHPPVYHAPVYHVPISVPRISAGSSAGALGGSWFHPPRRPIRPFPPVVVVYYPLLIGPAQLWQFDSWWASYELLWAFGDSTAPYYQYSPPNYVVAPQYEPAVYGEESEDLPQLNLKDGSILSVTDYWVVEGRLHFTMIEQEGAKPVEHDIPFEALDLQKTIDANTRRGFRFMLRNEAFEQYVRDHPDGDSK